MAEGLSAGEVGKEISEHRERNSGDGRFPRWLPITEAILLSLVAVLAAYSGYAAAKWGTEGSLSIAKASAERTKANRADLEALQLRTLDSVAFNAALEAYLSGSERAFALAQRRLREGYKPAFEAWLRTRPLRNPDAPADPTAMPQYKIPQEAQARELDRNADDAFVEGRKADENADDYIRLTVFLATVLFLIGISTHFSIPAARYALLGTATFLLGYSVIELLALPGIPG